MNGRARSFGDERVESCGPLFKNSRVTRFSVLERRFKEARKLAFFRSIRWLERRLSTRKLYWIAWTHTFVRAALKGNPAPKPLPQCLDVTKSVRAITESRMKNDLNEILKYLPERLAEPKWTGRCRIEGLEPVLRARQNGRPVVLAFTHFSAFQLSRLWLRAAGVPAAALIVGNAEGRTQLERLEDRFDPFPELPTSFCQDRLREAIEFLAAGNPLLIAIDNAAGKQMNVPVGNGWSFQMATGAVRLAIRHQAELISCVVIDEGHWWFRVKLGRPVPAEYLAAGVDWTRAGKHLLAEMLPHFRNHPGHCSYQLIEYFQPCPPVPSAATVPDEFSRVHQLESLRPAG